MSVLFLLGMFLLVMTPLVLFFIAVLRFYRDVSRPPTEEELRVARDYNICPNCGMSLEQRWSHCPHCGAKLQKEEGRNGAGNPE